MRIFVLRTLFIGLGRTRPLMTQTISGMGICGLWWQKIIRPCAGKNVLKLIFNMDDYKKFKLLVKGLRIRHVSKKQNRYHFIKYLIRTIGWQMVYVFFNKFCSRNYVIAMYSFNIDGLNMVWILMVMLAGIWKHEDFNHFNFTMQCVFISSII